MQQWLGASPSRSRELRRSLSRLELIHSKNLRIGAEQTMQLNPSFSERYGHCSGKIIKKMVYKSTLGISGGSY
jgi:hypothetical protein